MGFFFWLVGQLVTPNQIFWKGRSAIQDITFQNLEKPKNVIQVVKTVLYGCTY